MQLVNACGNHVNLGVASICEVHHGIFAVVGCRLCRDYKIGADGLCLGRIVVPVVACRQPNGIARADNRLVADGYADLCVGDIAIAVGVAEGKDPVTHTGVGIDGYVNDIRVGDTVSSVAGDAITERSRTAREGDMEIFTSVVALADNSATQICRCLRIDGDSESSIVCTVVCSCYVGSHLGCGNLLSESLVEIPSAGGQSRGVASADDRLVADVDAHEVVGAVGVAARSVGEVGYAEARSCGRTQIDGVAVTVCNTVVVVAGDTIVEGSSTLEIDNHLGVVAVTDFPSGIMYSYLWSGIYNYFERHCGSTGATGTTTTHSDDTCVAVARMACLVACSCHIGEGGCAYHGACIVETCNIT